MNIPGLPTDNLYKFQALAGLFFILAVYYIAYSDLADSVTEVAELKSNSDILSAEYDYLQRSTEFLKQKVYEKTKEIMDGENLYFSYDEDSILNELSNGDTIEVSFLDWEYYRISLGEDPELDFILKTLSEDAKKGDELILESKKLQNKAKAIERGLFRGKSGSSIFMLFMFSGLYNCISGFYKWYHRHQKYLDEIIKKEIHVAKSSRKTSIFSHSKRL